MRISTSMLYDTNVATMNQQQAALMQTQQQLATGVRLINPSIDPGASAQALAVTQAIATNTQYTTNSNTAQSTLTLMDSALQGVTSTLQSIRSQMISAGNGNLTASQRQSIATNMSGQLQQLVSLANSTDGQGNYLFSGFQSRTQPFASTSAGYAYFGDGGQNQTQVSSTLQVGTTMSGADIFMRVKNGNGTFVTQAASGNTGTGVATQGNVVNPALLTGNNYSVAFSVAAGVTTYSVTNTSTGSVLSTGNAYVAGQAISFDGMQFNIQGAPANGDQFTVAPSSNVSIFKSVSDFVTALNTPGAALGISNAVGNLDAGISSVSNANTRVGTNLQLISAAQATGNSLGLNYQQTLSQLQDTNYTQAATTLAQENLALQAAQKSFVQVSGLSLFNYMP
ncbi:MAG: flagellar hook-associated protein FlgL [Gallionella sp.]|nr:flagellar hook-associated protein FlgL [Gallionella sp.]